jgi:butyryl-CoA dehydrogenase
MDFEPTEQQAMFRDMVRDFARREIEPLARQMDEEGRIPETLLAKLRESGFFGLSFPEQYGGLGADTVTYALVVEELAHASAGVCIMVTVHNSVGVYPVAMFGSDELKAEYLPRMAAGEVASFCISEPNAGSDAASLRCSAQRFLPPLMDGTHGTGAFCLSEPEMGSDTASLRCSARRDGDRYILDGSKSWVTNGERAAFYVVLARTPGTSDHRSIHAFLVPRDSAGLSVSKTEDKMGLRASDTVTLDLDGVAVPVNHRLGAEGQGFKIAMTALDGGRIGVAFQALGIGRACLEETIKYAKVREQFGAPLASQPVVQNMIANMGTDLDAGRLLGLRAAWLKDQKLPFTKESAMAKLFATEAAGRAADLALQIHGGYGYVKDYPVERYYRDVRVTRIYEGTSEVQRLVIARRLLEEM